MRTAFALLLWLGLSLSAVAQQVPGLKGVWDQLVTANGKTIFLCKIRVDQSRQGVYSATTLERGRSTIYGTRVFNIRYDGKTLTCDSDWKKDGIAHFKLSQIKANRFEGWAYLKGKRVGYPNIWVRRS